MTNYLEDITYALFKKILFLKFLPFIYVVVA